MTTSFPPHKTLTSLPVTPSIALAFLTSYLDSAKSAPYLLPNARLGPNGVTAVSSSITIHNLERVQAGLRGQWLAPVLDLGEDDGTTAEVPVAEGLGLGGNQGGGEVDEMEVDGWQDLDEYQREQSVEAGDVGPRQSHVLQEGDSELDGQIGMIDEVAEGDERDDATKAKKVKTKHDVNRSSLAKPIDKEAKKKEKKRRLKLEKKERREAKKATK